MGYQERVQSLLAPRQGLRARRQYPGRYLGVALPTLFQDDALWLLPLWETWSAAHLKEAVVWFGVAELLREQCRSLARRASPS